MNRPTSPLFVVIILAWLTIALTIGGCNTVAGVGKDLGSAGDGIQSTAEETKPY